MLKSSFILKINFGHINLVKCQKSGKKLKMSTFDVNIQRNLIGHKTQNMCKYSVQKSSFILKKILLKKKCLEEI